MWSQVTVQVTKLHIRSRSISLIEEDRDMETAIAERNGNVEANGVQYGKTTGYLLKEHPAAET